MDALHSVSVAKVAELLDLNNLTKEMNLKERAIECSDVNRPAGDHPSGSAADRIF